LIKDEPKTRGDGRQLGSFFARKVDAVWHSLAAFGLRWLDEEWTITILDSWEEEE